MSKDTRRQGNLLDLPSLIFAKYCGEAIRAYIGTPDAVDYYLHYFQFEQDNVTVWRKSDIVEFLTGRPARRLEDWLVENRDAVLGRTGAPAAG